MSEPSPSRWSRIVVNCTDVPTIEAFDEIISQAATNRPLAIQGLDLRERRDDLLDNDWPHTVFLGCLMEDAIAHHVHTTGATVFPAFEGIPYNPFRGSLYTSDELREGDLDGAIYEHQSKWRKHPPAPILEALAQRVHDHAIDNALDRFLTDHEKVVAIMGGHGLTRDDDTYKTVVRIARALTRSGHLVVTGGGPGAMEAGNLGAWLAAHPDEALDQAVEMLSVAVDFSTDSYLEASAAVVAAFPDGSVSLAIPTWFYGHEPTNDFATAVAKYFSNSIREDGLLAIATHGVVYTPGAAGTVQEVFMDATQNHYNVFGVVSPMVFVDSAFWADDRLAAPLLLRQLAGDRAYGKMIAVCDDPEDVVSFITENPPITG